ncbi:sulfotransferase family 2 domain-containing protein [Burkholderia metallica]|uniref:sulfotransferase family 2 domain-containing protein n=1 Tax=Burkholderia metallica TaxID=488729 RepID=UPI001CF4E94C|nr:sulfotransferase family 2 domain-containing protein [Burkholderia metallica]MCA7998058.1 sulfotransferase family protein [Burkholderia metallica]
METLTPPPEFDEPNVATAPKAAWTAPERRRLSPGAEAFRLIADQPYGDDLIRAGVLRTPNDKVVFKHVEKIGCTTLKSILIDLFYPGALELPASLYHHDLRATTYDLTHNIAYDVLRMEVNDYILENCLWVTFCRNPYDRLMSCYRDKVIGSRASEHEYSNYMRREILFHEMRTSRYSREHFNEDGIPTFETFVHFVCSPGTPSDIHWRPQLLMNAANLVPNIRLIRFESFSADVTSVFAEELGVELALEERKNTSPRRPVDKTLKYSTELADLVFETYRADFEFFGYDQDSWKSS